MLSKVASCNAMPRPAGSEPAAAAGRTAHDSAQTKSAPQPTPRTIVLFNHSRETLEVFIAVLLLVYIFRIDTRLGQSSKSHPSPRARDRSTVTYRTRPRSAPCVARRGDCRRGCLPLT